MFTHQLLVFNIIYKVRTIHILYNNRPFTINFVKSTTIKKHNTEFTDNTTFGLKNYIISSLYIYILTQFKVYVLHTMFQFEHKKHS